MRLTLTTGQLTEIYAHLEAGKPNEACGLLGGQDGRVLKVYPVPSARPSPVRYLMEPGAQVEAMTEIDERGWELVGIFHSHPAGPPVPSATDVAEAYYPDSAYLICAPDSAGRWQARAFELRSGTVREIELKIQG